MKMNSILKGFLIKYSPAIILFIVRNYFGLDFLNDFNPFTSETKEFFNGNEGEGSNRQNNPQGSSIDPPSSEEDGRVVVSEEELEQLKALYIKNTEEEVRILEERKAEIKQQVRDFFDLKNQGEPEESLSNIKHQLAEDYKALREDYEKLKDKTHTQKAEVDKMFLELRSKSAQEVKEVEGGVVVSGKTLEEIKALYEKNSESFEKMITVSDKSVRQEISEKRRQIEEISRILAERKAEMEQRIRDFYDLKNQGQSEESLSDIKRQLVEDIKALHEDFTKLINRANNTREKGNKLFSELLSRAAKKMRDSTNESNNK